MTAPANNPFGPSSLGTANPFGAPAPSAMLPTASPFGAPAQSAFSGPSTNSPFSKPSPFAAPSSALTPAFGSPASSAFTSQAASRQPSPNPFGAPISQAPASNGFPPAPNGPARSVSPFPAQPRSIGAPGGQSSSNANTMAGFGKNSSGSKSAFGKPQEQKNTPQNSPFNPFKALGQKPAAGNSKPPPTGPKGFQRGQKSNALAKRIQPSSFGFSMNHSPNLEPTARTKELSPFAFNYANKLYVHLRKSGIRPPSWPPQVGNPSQMDVASNLKENYKKYRVKVYEALRKADLIDDPDRRRKLTDALPFKGISEGMCPDYEVATRIAESDVQPAERTIGNDGRQQPDPTRMVKKFARSSAGQDQPLPMDVRSVDALRRTTDYLFYDLLQSDDNLPNVHNFLWDRTRAVRKDFTFHSEKTGEEMKDLVYCFEAIARFHATSLHLLRRPGLEIRDGYDPAQECQQLGATLLSLTQAYDDCREKGVTCENEAEFRAYWLLINAHDEKIENRMLSWGKEFWFESEEVQTAIALINAKKDIRSPRGPMRPRRGPALSNSAFANFFEIVEDSRVSYTMACVASIYFNDVRRSILRNLVRAYARHRDAPRTITAEDLNKMLKFDTVDEAVTFAEAHDFEFSMEAPAGKPAPPEPYLVLNSKRKYVPEASVKQFLSHQLVERKRASQSLPFVIYNTIYDEPGGRQKEADDSPDSLFVSQSNDFPIDSPPAMASPPTFGSLSPTPSVFGLSGGSPAFGAPAAQTGFQASPFTQSPPSIGGFSQPTPPPNPFEAMNSTAQSPLAGAGSLPSAAQPTTSTTGDSSPSAPGTKLVSVFGETPQPSPFTGLGSGFSFTKPNAPAQLPSPQPPSLAPGGTGSTPTAQGPLAQPPVASPPKATTVLGQPTATPSAAESTSSNPLFALKADSATAAPAQPSVTAGSSFFQNKQPIPPPISATKPTGTFGGFINPPQPGDLLSPKPTAPPAAAPAPSSKPPQKTSTTPPASPPWAPLFPPGGGPPPFPKAAFTVKPPPSPPPPSPPPPPRDLMGDFSKWFVLGDTGLMDQFIEHTLGELVAQTFHKFKQGEAERIRKEEDEQSWKEARAFRVYSLGVKYFYRWQKTARARATQRILREGKEKMRRYREQERLAQQRAQQEAEDAAREARREARRNIMANGEHLSFLAYSGRRRASSRASATTEEQQLLATGVFAGLRDEQGTARRVVHGGGGGYAESVLELEPAPPPPRRPRLHGSPDSSTTTAATSVTSKGEGWKTRSLREKLALGGSHRRSASASSSVNGGAVANMRKSLPASRTSNFSRKRSADEDGSSVDGEQRNVRSKTTTTTNGFRTSHWDLRARGLVPMPDGKWLPEALARGVRQRRRDEEDGESVDSASTTTTTAGLRARLARLGMPTRRSWEEEEGRSPTPTPMTMEVGKRKWAGDVGEGSSPSAVSVKRAATYHPSHEVVADVQKMVRELKEAMDLLEEDRGFLREQSGVLGDGT